MSKRDSNILIDHRSISIYPLHSTITFEDQHRLKLIAIYIRRFVHVESLTTKGHQQPWIVILPRSYLTMDVREPL